MKGGSDQRSRPKTPSALPVARLVIASRRARGAPQRAQVERAQRHLDRPVARISVEETEVEEIIAVEVDLGERKVGGSPDSPANHARAVGRDAEAARRERAHEALVLPGNRRPPPRP